MKHISFLILLLFLILIAFGFLLSAHINLLKEINEVRDQRDVLSARLVQAETAAAQRIATLQQESMEKEFTIYDLTQRLQQTTLVVNEMNDQWAASQLENQVLKQQLQMALEFPPPSSSCMVRSDDSSGLEKTSATGTTPKPIDTRRAVGQLAAKGLLVWLPMAGGAWLLTGISRWSRR